MTPEERAEKIRKKIGPLALPDWLKFVADEIRDAEVQTEMYVIGVNLPSQIVAGYRRGRAEGLEDAATMIELRKGIAEHHSDIAALLRAEAKELLNEPSNIVATGPK